jgi:hypothetical protein
MTAVRTNMLKDKDYRSYCGNHSCSMPRLDKDFECYICGFRSKFDPEFAKQYLEKHGEMIPT